MATGSPISRSEARSVESGSVSLAVAAEQRRRQLHGRACSTATLSSRCRRCVGRQWRREARYRGVGSRSVESGRIAGWLKNNGGGNFTVGGVLYSDLEQPVQALALDVNGDGKPDIAELEPDPSNPGRYRWRRRQNNGGGNFTVGGVLDSDLEQPVQALALDVNGDGKPDIAELEPDPSNPGRYRWPWLQNNGGGNFTVGGVLYSDLEQPVQAPALDVNGDGKPDIAELEPDPSNPGRYRWLWLQNNGGGNFTVGGVLYSDLEQPVQALALDVNGDGKPDIAELEPDPLNAGRFEWTWRRNSGGGSFTTQGGVLFNALE